MTININMIIQCFIAAVKFVPQTLILAFTPLVINLLLGGIVAFVRIKRVKIVSNFFDFMISIFKGLPEILIIVIVSVGFSVFFDPFAQHFHLNILAKDVNRIYIAIFALTLTSFAMISESIRGALLSVDRNQTEAAYSVGLTTFQTFRRIILPQAFLVFLPSITGNILGLLKASALAYMVGVTDILNGAIIEGGASYSILEAYIAAAVVYWILSILIEQIGKALNNKIGIFRKAVF
jgi:ABC-type amino acid transport system, permease component